MFVLNCISGFLVSLGDQLCSSAQILKLVPPYIKMSSILPKYCSRPPFDIDTLTYCQYIPRDTMKLQLFFTYSFFLFAELAWSGKHANSVTKLSTLERGMKDFIASSGWWQRVSFLTAPTITSQKQEVKNRWEAKRKRREWGWQWVTVLSDLFMENRVDKRTSLNAVYLWGKSMDCPRGLQPHL